MTTAPVCQSSPFYKLGQAVCLEKLAAPAWGQALADVAKKGKAWVYPEIGSVSKTPMFSAINKALEFFRGTPSPKFYSSMKRVPRKFPGVVMGMGYDKLPTAASPRGKAQYGGLLGGTNISDAWTKLKEMQTFRRAARGDKDLLAAIPQTDSLQRVLGSAKTPEEVKAILAKQYGGKYVIKNITGAASGGINDQITDMSIDRRLGRLFKKRPNWGNYLIQNRRDMAQVTPVETWMDNIVANRWFGTDDMWFNRPSREMRVHALGGKVIRDATQGRGGNVLSAIFPMRTRNAMASEDLVERLLDRLPKKFRKGQFGFDVGIGADGKPFIIEANPTQYKWGLSGLLQNPWQVDAITSAMEGRTSGLRNMKQTAKAVGGAMPSAAIGGMTLNRYANDQGS